MRKLCKQTKTEIIEVHLLIFQIVGDFWFIAIGEIRGEVGREASLELEPECDPGPDIESETELRVLTVGLFHETDLMIEASEGWGVLSSEDLGL